MKRRGVTVLLGAVITALLAIEIMSARVPYVVLKPGPTVNTLGAEDGKDVIEVKGASTSTSQGQLRLVTVGVVPSTDLLSALKGWIDREDAVVPRELIYPPGQSEKEVEQRNADEFRQSQTSAETSALRELGYRVQVAVTKVVDGGPSAGVLQVGDLITSADGQPVTSGQRLTELIRAKPAGAAVKIGYTRRGQAATATITSRADKEGDPPRIGIEVDQKQPHPFELKIDLADIGGPSAGLMFALGIIDKLDPADLTGGKIIAGTGTIDDEGNVGAIGGIPQKLVGAKAARASYFLTPAENCAEAIDNAQPGLPLVKVSTLDDALGALKALREGREPALCGR